MLQRSLRMEFADFCRAQGARDYDCMGFQPCAVAQFERARGTLGHRQAYDLFMVSQERPWNFRALAARLAR